MTLVTRARPYTSDSTLIHYRNFLYLRVACFDGTAVLAKVSTGFELETRIFGKGEV
jgi:hypothetical protein